MSWGALALSLSVLGGIYTWWALRHRGVTAAVRGAGITLLPLAAWMTGLLSVFGDVVDTFGTWFAHLIFSPKVWLGMILFVVAFVLIGGANALARRSRPDAAEPGGKPSKGGKPKSTKSVAATSAADPLIDDDLAEIQAILKKRGIS